MTPVLRMLTWSGSALCVLTLLPLPGPLRLVIALLAVLVAFPLASAPFWIRWLPAAPGSTRPRAWTLAAAALVISMLPAALFTALGLAGVPLGILAALSLALPPLTTGFAVVRGRMNDRPDVARFAAPAGWLELAAAAAPALLVIILAAAHGTPMGATDDALDHVATLRQMTIENRIDFPGADYAVDRPAGQDPRKGALLSCLAIAARLARADVVPTWHFSAVVLGALMVLAYAALALALFGRWGAALAGTVALVFLWDDPFWLLRGGYGGHWGLAIAWAATALLVSGGGMGWGIVAGIATAAVHAYSPFQLLAPLLLLFAARLLWRRLPLGVNGSAILGVILGAAPLEVARRLLAGPSINPLHRQSMEWLALPPGPIASPLQVLNWYGYAGVAALAAALLIAPFRRDRPGLFIIASALAPLLLLFNPWLFRPVGEWIGSLSNKLALDWAYPLAIAWTGMTIFGAVARPGDERPPRRRLRLAATLTGIVIASAIAISLPMRLDAIASGPAPLSGPLRSGMALIRDQVPPDGVVASDPLTSYAIPALTGRRTIVTLSQHAPPGDARSLERLETVAELYSDCVPLEAALERARREGAQYLLALAPGPGRTDEFGARSDPRNAAILGARFESRPDRLRRLAGDRGAVLYEINLPDGSRAETAGQMLRPASLAGAPASPMTGPGTAGAPPVKGPAVTDGTVTFALESLPFQSCRRGQSLRLPAAWRLERPSTVYLEYSGHIRFENEALPPIGMPWALIAKPLRWLILEPRSGGSYRWSDVEIPFRGLCPVAAWPAGEWLPDTLQVEVPPQLVRGRYRVRMALERLSVYPVITLADLLREEDRFSGPVAGVMEIE